jgi:2-amino-1-hydroxyethylphosphonate dioxygenase (glycine-forming)
MSGASNETAPEEIWSLLVHAESMPYIGEPISQMEHGLQAADRAAHLGASSALVLAALLHDVGHLLEDHEQMAALGVKNHENIGADYLASLGFSKQVCELVRLHVDAKRYLCSKTPKYLSKLSEASLATLKWQGGPMTEVECRTFEAHDLFEDAIRLRTFDEYAKITDIRSQNRARYRALITTHLRDSKGPQHATP